MKTTMKYLHYSQILRELKCFISASNAKKQLSGAVYVDQYKPPPTSGSKGETVSVTAITCGEIGGSNSMEPFIYGAYHDMVIVDCDEMGRAFPELQVSRLCQKPYFLALNVTWLFHKNTHTKHSIAFQMATPTMYGVSPYPAAIADYKGNTSVITHAESPKSVEEVFRLKCVDMGYTTS